MATFSMSFSLVQLTVPDELRGRVVSIYMVALRSGLPIGALVAGAFADLTVFDPATIVSRFTVREPRAYPGGIVHVLVNGRFAMKDGARTGVNSGRVLRDFSA